MVDGAAWVGRQLVEIGGGGCERERERRDTEGDQEREIDVLLLRERRKVFFFFFFLFKITLIFFNKFVSKHGFKNLYSERIGQGANYQFSS